MIYTLPLSLACQGRAGMDGRRKKLEIWKNGTKKKEEKKKTKGDDNSAQYVT